MNEERVKVIVDGRGYQLLTPITVNGPDYHFNVKRSFDEVIYQIRICDSHTRFMLYAYGENSIPGYHIGHEINTALVHRKGRSTEKPEEALMVGLAKLSAYDYEKKLTFIRRCVNPKERKEEANA